MDPYHFKGCDMSRTKSEEANNYVIRGTCVSGHLTYAVA